MPNIATATAQLLADGRPVLFLDTCSILDVIRATYRCLKDCVQRASQLMGMATSVPPQCTLVVASMVHGEWNNHAQAIRNEVDKHLVKIQEYATHFHDAYNILGIPLTFGRPAYAGMGLTDALHTLSQSLLDNAVRLDSDKDCTNRGVTRVVTKTPPSKQGGEVKDCVIIEEYLEVCRQLQGAGLPGNAFSALQTRRITEAPREGFTHLSWPTSVRSAYNLPLTFLGLSMNLQPKPSESALVSKRFKKPEQRAAIHPADTEAVLHG